MAAAALLVEATLTGANQFTPATAFRGRVNVYVQDTTGLTGGAWSGWIHLQRRFQKSDLTYTPWETIEAYNQPGNHVFVEHENGVQYQLGIPSDSPALSGGTPYVRISQ